MGRVRVWWPWVPLRWAGHKGNLPIIGKYNLDFMLLCSFSFEGHLGWRFVGVNILVV